MQVLLELLQCATSAQVIKPTRFFVLSKHHEIAGLVQFWISLRLLVILVFFGLVLVIKLRLSKILGLILIILISL